VGTITDELFASLRGVRGQGNRPVICYICRDAPKSGAWRDGQRLIQSLPPLDKGVKWSLIKRLYDSNDLYSPDGGVMGEGGCPSRVEVSHGNLRLSSNVFSRFWTIV